MRIRPHPAFAHSCHRVVTDLSQRTCPGAHVTNYHRIMPARVLHADDAFWRPSNQLGVLNTDLGKQLEAATLAARLWRLTPGQTSTKHRHTTQTELYVVIEGIGRMRIDDDDPLTLAPHSTVLVEPDTVRQIFNDTADDALWLVVGTPPELANTLEMSDELLAFMYPDGPRALPPELAGG